jgi:hypothetical protein
VALRTIWAPISDPRKAAAVSVVKNGLPVPAAKTTTLPSSRYCKALPWYTYKLRRQDVGDGAGVHICK